MSMQQQFDDMINTLTSITISNLERVMNHYPEDSLEYQAAKKSLEEINNLDKLDEAMDKVLDKLTSRLLED